jgi:CubicO group peptidase (beta-lactamase class C family)
MAKTVLGLLVGIAVSEGAIKSIDDPAATYVPELAGTEYGATSIRAFLQMSSGVAFSETYQPDDDVSELGKAVFSANGPGSLAAVKQFNTASRRRHTPSTIRAPTPWCWASCCAAPSASRSPST